MKINTLTLGLCLLIVVTACKKEAAVESNVDYEIKLKTEFNLKTITDSSLIDSIKGISLPNFNTYEEAYHYYTFTQLY